MSLKHSLAVLLLAVATAVAQDQLTNDAVAKMVKAGLGEGIIVSTIQSQPGSYKLGPDDLVNLKQQGVTDKELAAMISKNAGGGSAAAPQPSAASADLPANIEVGVYYKRKGAWEDLNPEVVNWKTGGVLKSVASAGIVKGDVNGHIQGGSSKTSINTPVQLLVYTPEGVAITEYQLIRLRAHENSREFRTVTGGVLHVSGGATRDLMQFDSKKLAPRTYEIDLTGIGPGEYGLLPPGAVTSANSASIGKIYSFHVVE